MLNADKQKKILLADFYFRDFLALNVYVALCYYKLDYYDVSQVSILTASLIVSVNFER